MHKESLAEIARRYGALIIEKSAPSVSCRRLDDGSAKVRKWEDKANHLLWMLDKIESGDMDDEKAMRWLCFVQGALWFVGDLGITNAGVHNYRILNEGQEPPTEDNDGG